MRYLLTVEKVVTQQFSIEADSSEEAVEAFYSGVEMEDEGELVDGFDEGFVISVEEYEDGDEGLRSGSVDA